MQRKDNSSLTKTVGKRLSALRSAKKMSQEEFAKRVGISRGYLSDLERGVREMSLATLAVVCRKSGTTPNKLLGGPMRRGWLGKRVLAAPGRWAEERE